MWIVTIHNKENLQTFCTSCADAIVVGMKGISSRACLDLQFDEIKDMISIVHAYGKKLYVNAQKIFVESDVDKMKQCMDQLALLDVDGIYYSDEGLLYEAITRNMEHKLIYQPETLVASSFDVDFYLREGMLAVSLAHELSLDEILAIAKNVSNIELLAFGYVPILHSRRPLLTNYRDAVHVEYEPKNVRYDLIESTRTDRMPIIEADGTTTVFSAYPFGCAKELDALIASGISRYRVDSYLFDDEWALNILKAIEDNDIERLSAFGDDRWYSLQSTKTKEA